MNGGVATGIGSLPGDDVDAALALVFEELPDLPHLPELPGRGAGADLIGRTAAVLAELHVDLQPAGWRLVPRPALDEQRAVTILERDLDALVPVAPGYDGRFKVQLCGPWTLAAALELPRGGKVIGDTGAVRDLVESLAETVRMHVTDVRRRLPGAELILQLDEPSLPAVLAGQVATESGLSRFAAVDAADATATLQQIVSAAGVPVVVHCCAPTVPVAMLHEAGVAAVSLDLTVAAPRLDVDEVGERVERGLGLWLGVVPSLGPGRPPAVREVLEPVRRLGRQLALDEERLAAVVTLTPACGLAGASQGWARTALRLVVQAGRALAGAPAEAGT